MKTTQKERQIAQRVQDNPKYFINEVLKDTLWDKQEEIIQSVKDNRRTSVKSCHGAGKSFIAARTALWFLYTHPNSKVITTAPSFRQVEDILWREIRKAHVNSNGVLDGALLHTAIDISEDWFALGLSTDEPDRFQGFHAIHILLIIDEASGVAQPIFEASEGIVSSDGARVLYIGNPTTVSGEFFNSFRIPSYKHIHISAFDTPNFTTFGITLDDIRNNTWKEKITAPLPNPYLITPEWVYDKYLKWGEDSPMWFSRVIAEFPQQGEDTLISLAKIEKATIKINVPLENDPEVVGVDIARFGVDKTVFCLRKGAGVLDIKEFAHMDTVQTSGYLRTYMGEHPFASVHIDEVGVGAGVLDQVKTSEVFKNVQGINVGVPSNEPEMFFNLRAEIYWNLRERFNNEDIAIPVDEELMSQLSNIKFKYTTKGQIQIEPKEEMKKRGLPSPDKADALALAFMKPKEKPGLISFMEGYKQT